MNTVPSSCNCACFCRNEATPKVMCVTFTQFHTNVSLYVYETTFSNSAHLVLEICRLRMGVEEGDYLNCTEKKHEHFNTISRNGE